MVHCSVALLGFLLLELLLQVEVVESWQPVASFIRSSHLFAKMNNKMPLMEDGVDLSRLSEHNIDGQWLGKSITRYLDNEWIQLPIHEKIGGIVSNVYIECRSRGVNDVGEILMNVGNTLENVDIIDSFVNAWDIGNKVSDLLMVRLDRELCSCAGDMDEYKVDSNEDFSIEKVEYVSIPADITSSKQVIIPCIPTTSININAFNDAIETYKSLFTRYKFMRDFLDGELELRSIQNIFTIVLGFRLSNDKSIKQDPNVAAYGWDGLTSVPIVVDIDNEAIAARLKHDVPEEDEPTDIMMESLVGIEMYKLYKKDVNNKDKQHRILLCKWLYTHGFVNEDFPVTARYVPTELANR